MLTGSYFVGFDLEGSYIVTISARQHTGKFSICAIRKRGITVSVKMLKTDMAATKYAIMKVMIHFLREKWYASI